MLTFERARFVIIKESNTRNDAYANGFCGPGMFDCRHPGLPHDQQ